MQVPLRRKLRRLRTRVRATLALYGLSCMILVALAGLVVFGLLDWWLHVDNAGVRIILGAGTLAGLLWATYRYLLLPMSVRLRDVDLAVRVEDRYPELNDSLASTVEFLQIQPGDAAAGSAVLRAAVVEQTLAATERLDLRDVVDTRAVRTVAIAAALVCLLAGGLAAADPGAAGRVLSHLFNPLEPNPWPQQTNLAVDWQRTPRRLARGDTFEVWALDEQGRRLPERGDVEFRFADGDTSRVEALRRDRTDNGSSGQDERLYGRLENVPDSFEFRVTAGDDATMPWHAVEAVPPPVMAALEMRIEHPAYTGLATTDWEPAPGLIEALVGSTIHFRAACNKPLGEVRVQAPGAPASPMIGADGAADMFTVSLPVVESGPFWFELTDAEGFVGRDVLRREIRAITDAVPQVHLELRSSNANVTPNAVVRLHSRAQDDYGLAAVRLHYSLSSEAAEVGEAPEHERPLFEPGDNRQARQFVADEHPEADQEGFDFSLAELALAHGAVITLHAEATDFYDLGDPHVGRSGAIRLTVVSEDVLTEILHARQAAIQQELARILTMQEQAHRSTEGLLEELAHSQLDRGDLDELHGAELTQQNVRRALLETVRTSVEELLADIDANRIDDAETRQRLEQIGSEIDRLDADHLPVIQGELHRAREEAEAAGAGNVPPETDEPQTPPQGEAQAADTRDEFDGQDEDDQTEGDQAEDDQAEAEDEPRPRGPVGEPLANAEEHQEEVEDTLRAMLDQLREWESINQVAQDLQNLAADQQELNETTGRLGEQTRGRRPEDLTAGQRGDLARASGEQQEHADRMERIQARMDQLRQQLADSDPMAAAALEEALEHARSQDIAGQMREASRSLDPQNNQVLEAGNQQRAVAQALRELQDLLENRRENELARIVQLLEQAQRELADIRRQQEALLERTQEADAEADQAERRRQLEELARQQQELEEQSRRMARQLERLSADQAGQSTRGAAGRMGQAQQSMAQGQSGRQGAQQQQREALDQLQDAEQELAQRLQEAREQLAMEQLARIADELAAMIERENQVIEETERLEALRQQQGNLTRAQLQTLRRLVNTQQVLREDTERLVERLTAAEVFALALRGAARNMERAIGRLEERLTDEATVQAETAARRRFEELIAALEPEEPEEGGEQQQGGSGGGQQGGQPGDGVPPLAQLKMLRTLQQEINARTQELAERMADGGLTPAEEAEFEALSEEQGALADIVRNFTRPQQQQEEPLLPEE